MIKEVDLYLDPKSLGKNGAPPLFAYGNPGYLRSGLDRATTEANLRKIRSRWQNEFDALREVMLICIEDFDADCNAASEQYKRTETRSGPRIRDIQSELQGMPPPYAALCRDLDKRLNSSTLTKKFSDAVSRHNPESIGRYGSAAPILLATEAYDANPRKNGRNGDTETGGNPIMVRGWLNFSVDRAGESITGYLGVNFTEYEGNYSGTNLSTELGGSTSATVFSIDKNATDPDVEPEFPSSCKIEKDYPFAGHGLSLALDTNNKPMTSRYLGTVPPGAPGAFIQSASLSSDIKVTNRSYGYVQKLSEKNQHNNFRVTQYGAEGYRDSGLLNSLSCTPDTSGDDRHRGSGNDVDDGASCSDLEIPNIKINLYPKEDDGAAARNQKFRHLKDLEIVKIRDRLRAKKAAILFAQSSQIPFIPFQTPTGDDACENAVQNKIAWDAAGHRKRWAANNIALLCGTATNSAEPAVCFNEIMRGGYDNGSGGTVWPWGRAAELCASTVSSSETVSCYSQAVLTVGHARAIESCKS